MLCYAWSRDWSMMSSKLCWGHWARITRPATLGWTVLQVVLWYCSGENSVWAGVGRGHWYLLLTTDTSQQRSMSSGVVRVSVTSQLSTTCLHQLKKSIFQRVTGHYNCLILDPADQAEVRQWWWHMCWQCWYWPMTSVTCDQEDRSDETL